MQFKWAKTLGTLGTIDKFPIISFFFPNPPFSSSTPLLLSLFFFFSSSPVGVERHGRHASWSGKSVEARLLWKVGYAKYARDHGAKNFTDSLSSFVRRYGASRDKSLSLFSLFSFFSSSFHFILFIRERWLAFRHEKSEPSYVKIFAMQWIFLKRSREFIAALLPARENLAPDIFRSA